LARPSSCGGLPLTAAGLELLERPLVLVEQRQHRLGVELEAPGAAAEEPLHEHRPRERAEAVLFQGLDAGARDLGVDRQLLDAHPAALSLVADVSAR
jgi:hypothetical protein